MSEHSRKHEFVSQGRVSLTGSCFSGCYYPACSKPEDDPIHAQAESKTVEYLSVTELAYRHSNLGEYLAQLERELSQAHQQLREMTADRDLWQQAHDDEGDCPYKNALDEAQQRIKELEARAECKAHLNATACRYCST